MNAAPNKTANWLETVWLLMCMNFFLTVSVCSCVRTCMCICGYSSYMCVHICVETKDRPSLFSLVTIHCILWGTVSPSNPECDYWVSQVLRGLLAFVSCMLGPQVGHGARLAVTLAPRLQILLLTLVQQVVCPMSHFPQRPNICVSCFLP